MKNFDTNIEEIQNKIINKLIDIYDPEIPVNIYDLGLIYSIDLEGKDLEVIMTLTSPHCPVAEDLVSQVRLSLLSLEDIDNVEVNLTFDPPWTKEMMSDEARMILGF